MFTPLDFDRPRRLRFDIQACYDLEQALNAPLGEIILQLNRLSITATCACLWAGLKHEDPTLNQSGVRKRLETFLVNGGKLKVVNDALNAALSDSTPLRDVTDDAEPEGNAPPEPAEKG